MAKLIMMNDQVKHHNQCYQHYQCSIALEEIDNIHLNEIYRFIDSERDTSCSLMSILAENKQI